MIDANVPRIAVALHMLQEMEKASSWCGETHLQKSLFLLQSLGRVQVDYKFIIYKHGPYSFDLHEDVSWLESSFLMKRSPSPPYGAKLTVSDLGHSYLSRVSDALSPTTGAVRSIALRFSVLTVAELERYSTAAYVDREYPNLTDEQRVDKLRELKPHIDQSEAVSSFAMILLDH